MVRRLLRAWRHLVDRMSTRGGDGPSPPTPRSEWTLPGVFFDTTGWRLTAASESRMTWAGDTGGEMSLTRLLRSPSEAPAPLDLDAARRDHRARLAATGGGLVSAEPVVLSDGRVGLAVIGKRHAGLGFGFDGVLIVEDADRTHRLELSMDESLTGMRESLVDAARLAVGEFRLDDATLGPPDPETGARPVKGLTGDPYDPAFDAKALYSAPDDPRLDEVLPDSPLSVIRASLERAGTSWESESPAADPRAPRPASDGPRRLLTDAALRQIYWATGRNDLLQRLLQAELSAADVDGASGPDHARRLLMLGLAQHNSGQAQEAVETFERAVKTLAAPPAGRERELGVALSLLGRSLHALDRSLEAHGTLKRAIALLEKHDDVDVPLANALSITGTILAEQRRVQEARSMLERAQTLIARNPAATGPATLDELTGGTPPALHARVRVVRGRRKA